MGGSIVGSSGGAAAQAPGAQPAQPAKPDSSGSFVGISSYLNANKAQSQKLGNQAAGVVNNQAGTARSSVNDLNTKFNNQVDQNTIQNDQGALDVASTQAQNLNAGQKAQLQKQYNASYAGPQNITDLNDDYVNSQKAVNQANTSISGAGTEEGRKGIVKNLNSKGYRGAGNLDNLLLQAGGGKEKLAEAANANKDVSGLLDQSSAAAQAKSAQAQAQADVVKAQTRSAIGQVDDPSTPNIDESAGAFGGIQSYLRGQAGQANAQRDALGSQITGLQDDPNTLIDESTQLSPQMMQALGIKAGDNLYDVDVRNYLNPNQVDAQESDFIDQDRLAQYNALNEISGGVGGQYSKVGAGYNPINSNFQGLKDQLGARKTDSESYQNLGGNEGASVKRGASDLATQGKNNIPAITQMNGYASPDAQMINSTRDFLNKIGSVSNISDMKAVRDLYNSLPASYQKYIDNATGKRGGDITDLFNSFDSYSSGSSKYKSDRKATSKEA